MKVNWIEGIEYNNALVGHFEGLGFEKEEAKDLANSTQKMAIDVKSIEGEFDKWRKE